MAAILVAVEVPHAGLDYPGTLRRAMVRPGRDRLSGEVEVDETAIGAPIRRRGRGGFADKAIGVGRSAPTSQQDYSLLLETAIRTGLRLGELLGLQWRDLDLKQGILYVRRQWTRDHAYAEPKTQAAIRQVPLAPEMVKKLAEHKLASDFSGDEEPVFASSTGKPFNHRNVAQRGFEAAAKEAGLLVDEQPRITFHDLRYAFASIMIERGLSSTVLAHVMGHRDATTTERKYIYLFNRQRTDEQVRAAMQSAMAL